MTAPVQEGDVLGGKFRVERVLGTGGMGVVVAAQHLQLDQRVALKFLLPTAAKEPEVVTRFAREARAAAKIQSEHVARVLDVGTLDTGAPYMVMEYLEGEDLDLALKASGAMPIADVVRYILQTCEAVAEAHALGIIHRDLKPANLFLAERADGSRSVKVLDFGISKLMPDGQVADASLTKTHAVMGSPMYMSPEQLRSARDVDARADIWALGIIMYEMLCGKGPFSEGTVPEVCAAILKDTPEPPRKTRGDLPAGLEAVVLKCIEKDAAKRYANVAELALAMLSFGPPGSELSIERISRVLQKGAKSGRSAAVPASVPPPAKTSDSSIDVSVELAATRPVRPALTLAEALAETRVENRGKAEDVGATHSASSVSAWNQKPAEPKRGKAVWALVGIAVLGGGVSAYWFAGRKLKLDGEGTAVPASAEPTSSPTTPVQPAVATVAPDPTVAPTAPPEVPPEPGAASASALAPPSAPPVNPRTLPWGRPRPSGSAAASATADATAGASARATSAPSGTPSSKPGASATAAPSSKPK